MMQAANIPLGHLYSSGFQPDIKYTPEQQEFVNLLSDKTGYINDRQNEEIGKMMAGFRVPELIAELQPKAQARIDQHIADLRNLYNDPDQKSRPYKLTAANQLKHAKMLRQLNFDMIAMKKISDNYDQELKTVPTLIANQHLTPDEAAIVESEFRKKASDPNVGFGDIPSYTALLSKYVTPRQKAAAVEDAHKKFNEIAKDILDGNTGDQNTKPSYDEFMRKFDAIYPNGVANQMYGYAQKMGMIPPDADAREIVGKALYERVYPKERAAGTNVHIGNGNNLNNKGLLEIPYTTIPGMSTMGFDYSTLQPSDKPKWSGSLTIDNEGTKQNLVVSNAEINNQFWDDKAKKWKGTLVGTGTLSGGSTTDKYQIPAGTIVTIDDKSIDNVLDKKKFKRTFNGNDWRVDNSPYQVSPGKKPKTETEAQKLGI